MQSVLSKPHQTLLENSPPALPPCVPRGYDHGPLETTKCRKQVERLTVWTFAMVKFKLAPI